MHLAVYPGSFDPITNGHIDVLERGSKLFDKIVIAVIHNVSKNALFTLDERVELIKRSAAHIPNVEVELFSGLLVNYVTRKKACAIIRGLRTVTDFEYELHLAMMNKELLKDIDTVFLASNKSYIFISSSTVKEAAMLGGNVQELVPAPVFEALTLKYKDKQANKE